MTKNDQTKIIEDLEKKNRLFLATLILIQTSSSWDAKTIRAQVHIALADAIKAPLIEAEKPKRIRKQRELEPA